MVVEKANLFKGDLLLYYILKVIHNIMNYLDRKINNIVLNKSQAETINLDKSGGLQKTLEKITQKLTGISGILIKSGGKIWTLHHETLSRIINGMINQQYETKSDDEIVQHVEHIGHLEIMKVERDDVKTFYKHNKGAFFPYYNKTDFDLSKYGIYEDFQESNSEENCLVLALRHGGMTEEKLNHLKSKMRDAYTPKCKLREISESLNIQINLNTDTNTREKSRIERYGKSDEQYNLGLLEEHFFINEDVSIGSYAIKNHQDIKDKKEWWRIIDKRGKKESIPIKTYQVVKHLLDNKENCLLAVPIEDRLKTQYHLGNQEILNLEYDKDK